MATPTKVTKKNPAKKAAKAVRRPTDDQTPAGFEDLTASYEKLPKWNFEENEQLDATVTRISEVKVTKRGVTRDTKVAHVVTEDGEEFALWQSAALVELFDALEKGDVIRVIYTGMIELDSERDMHTFKCYRRAK